MRRVRGHLPARARAGAGRLPPPRRRRASSRSGVARVLAAAAAGRRSSWRCGRCARVSSASRSRSAIASASAGRLFALLLLWVTSYRNSWGMIFHTDNLLVLHALRARASRRPRARARARRARRATPRGRRRALRLADPAALRAHARHLLHRGLAKLRGAGLRLGRRRHPAQLHRLRRDAQSRSSARMHSPFGAWLVQYDVAVPARLGRSRWCSSSARRSRCSARAARAGGRGSAVGVPLRRAAATMAIAFPYPLSGIALRAAASTRAHLALARLAPARRWLRRSARRLSRRGAQTPDDQEIRLLGGPGALAVEPSLACRRLADACSGFERRACLQLLRCLASYRFWWFTYAPFMGRRRGNDRVARQTAVASAKPLVAARDRGFLLFGARMHWIPNHQQPARRADRAARRARRSSKRALPLGAARRARSSPARAREIEAVLHGARPAPARDRRPVLDPRPGGGARVRRAACRALRARARGRAADRACACTSRSRAPRVGWKGLINDPHLDGSCDIATGLRVARKLLLELARARHAGRDRDARPGHAAIPGRPVRWTAIGARTTESQTHREMASGLVDAGRLQERHRRRARRRDQRDAAPRARRTASSASTARAASASCARAAIRTRTWCCAAAAGGPTTRAPTSRAASEQLRARRA